MVKNCSLAGADNSKYVEVSFGYLQTLNFLYETFHRKQNTEPRMVRTALLFTLDSINTMQIE